MNGSKKRLFVAIPLPAEILQKLEDLQYQFKRYARDAKWVKVQGIHLTLKFLGYVDSEKIPAIKAELSPVAGTVFLFSVQVKGCGFFPNPRRPNVLWAGVDSSQLLSLQLQVEEATLRLGFEKEDRPFGPHLTLARFRDSRGLLPLIQETEKWKETLLGEFGADSIVLYESILHREGAEYHKLETFPFGT